MACAAQPLCRGSPAHLSSPSGEPGLITLPSASLILTLPGLPVKVGSLRLRPLAMPICRLESVSSACLQAAHLLAAAESAACAPCQAEPSASLHLAPVHPPIHPCTAPLSSVTDQVPGSTCSSSCEHGPDQDQLSAEHHSASAAHASCQAELATALRVAPAAVQCASVWKSCSLLSFPVGTAQSQTTCGQQQHSVCCTCALPGRACCLAAFRCFTGQQSAQQSIPESRSELCKARVSNRAVPRT